MKQLFSFSLAITRFEVITRNKYPGVRNRVSTTYPTPVHLTPGDNNRGCGTFSTGETRKGILVSEKIHPIRLNCCNF